MNKIYVIGNVTKDAELKSTATGIQVCTFTIAVNGKKDEVQYFRCTAWRQLADICAKYLTKGKKVCVIGSISASAYADKEGKPRASLEVNAEDIEFLSTDGQGKRPDVSAKVPGGFTPVPDDEELPF